MHMREETGLKVMAGGSAMEAIGALAAIALSIVGLAGVLSNTMAAICTIIVGAAILIEGGAFGAARWAMATAEGTSSVAGGGVSAEFLAGVAGIVLGILALLGVSAPTLLSVAVLGFGASFLVSGMVSFQSNWFASVSPAHVFVGLAATVLGILAVIGLDQMVLVLVGLLCLGAGSLFRGSAQGVKAAGGISNYSAPA